MKKFSKIFMIFCVLFSQFSGILQVLAEEYVETSSLLLEEESAIIATLDDEYNLTIKSKSEGIISDDSKYDIYLTSSYKYAYDNSEKAGYNEEKINIGEPILGAIFNSESGYSIPIESIETKYNGEFSVIVELKNVDTLDIYSTTTEPKIINQEDTFNILANENLIEENNYTVSETNKEIEFTPVISLNSIKNGIVYNVYINDALMEGKYTVNYENMLYGTYSYKWDIKISDEIYKSNTIYVKYDSEDNISMNAKILNDNNTKGVKFVAKKAYITNELSIVDFLSSINMEKYNTKIVDSENNPVTEGNIGNGMSLIISKDGLVEKYNIVVVGDVDSDGDVDQEDIIAMTNSILTEEDYYNDSADVNIDSKVNVFDITKTMDALINGWDNKVTIDYEESLTPVLSSNVTKEVKIGDTITVRFALNNFEKNMIDGISGKIEYDNNILHLDEILTTGMEMYYNEKGEFIAFGKDYNSEEDFIEITFTAIGASEEEYISISSLVASYAGEEVKMNSDSVSMMFKVTYTSNIGGDIEETSKDNETTLVNNEIKSSTRVLSSDSFLSNLTIKDHEIDFSPYTFKYNIKVDKGVTSLELNAILSDYRATYAVYGNENFQAGENIVTIVVTAEDSSTHTYTLIVEKEDEKTTDKKDSNTKEEKEENSISKTVIIVLIILVIIGLIYLIFKDDEEENEKKD